MANPKLVIEFLSGGGSSVHFSSIKGVTPGMLVRAHTQARHELRRLCAVAGVEARRRKAEAEKAVLYERTPETSAETETTKVEEESTT